MTTSPYFIMGFHGVGKTTFMEKLKNNPTFIASGEKIVDITADIFPEHSRHGSVADTDRIAQSIRLVKTSGRHAVVTLTSSWLAQQVLKQDIEPILVLPRSDCQAAIIKRLEGKAKTLQERNVLSMVKYHWDVLMNFYNGIHHLSNAVKIELGPKEYLSDVFMVTEDGLCLAPRFEKLVNTRAVI